MIRIHCGAKVNLGLRILGKEPNGYHIIDSFFCPLKEPFDTILVEEQQKNGIRIETSCPDIDPKNNTLTKIYKALEKFGTLPGIYVHLTKGIPVGAGLGGGSSDAANLLKALLPYLPKQLTRKEQILIAKSVGADIPFFIDNVPARVGGIGEHIEPAVLSCMPCKILLVYPKIAIDTSWAYKAYDACPNKDKYSSLTKQSFLSTLQLRYKDSRTESWDIKNALECVCMERYPELASLVQKLFTKTSWASGMSGSGSTLFALYPNTCTDQIQNHAEQLQKNGYQCTTTTLDE